VRHDLYKVRNVAVLILLTLFLSLPAYSQVYTRKDLFNSIEKQEVNFLKEYIDLNDNLDLYNNEGKSLMYVAVDSWNLPAVEILLENNSHYRYQNIKKLLRHKTKTGEKLTISEENYKAHDRVKEYLDPFEDYQVRNNSETIENFRPALSPPSYSELKQIFNKAKPQFDIMVARRVRTGLGSELNYRGFTTGAGIVLPVFRNYSSRIKAGQRNITLRDGPNGKTIYFDNEVFQLDQLDIQQSFRQSLSFYFQVTGAYSSRLTQMLPESPDFITEITSEDYNLSIKTIDITPAVIFKYGVFYFKSGIEIRKNLKTSLLWADNSEDGKNQETDITGNAQPNTTAFVWGAGIDVQFAYFEFGKSYAATEIFQTVPGAFNWRGWTFGLRL
jgi:hypothetical protein